MQARVTVPIYDMVAGCSRKVGDVFEVSEERFAEMNSTAAGEVAEAVGQEDGEAAEKPKRRTRKAAEK